MERDLLAVASADYLEPRETIEGVRDGEAVLLFSISTIKGVFVSDDKINDFNQRDLSLIDFPNMIHWSDFGMTKVIFSNLLTNE